MAGIRVRALLGTLLILGCGVSTQGATAGAAAPYFEGKTITVVEGRSPGGSGNIKTQLSIQAMLKYLPGKPAVVYRYIPGAGGARSVNHVIGKAPRNGLVIGGVSTAVVSSVITGARGVRFKLEDLVWLGTSAPGSPTAVVVRPGLGIDSVEKLRAYKGLRFPNRNVGHTIYIRDRLTAFVLELKEPRWVLG
ncbi:MAG TPA: hypothetical protein VGB25_00130 [Candidatus Binatia bacterium]